MHDLDASLAQMRNAWLAGRSALDSAPPQWRDAIGADELALIALAGHATDVLTRQTPGPALAARPLLPVLVAPVVPDPLRSRFRRVLATPKNAPSLEQPLIAFVAARGFTAHPADWMPGAKDDWAPDIYAPWLDWVRAEAHTAIEAEITAENYDQFSWTERRNALRKLRAQDADAARAVIAAKAGAEPPDRRLRLVELLATGLRAGDTEYLESLLKDRSDRVQATAKIFLSRLGRANDGDALAAELAELVDVAKTGLINRRSRLVIKPLKTSAQIKRLFDLFNLVSLPALARVLSVSEEQLVEATPDGVGAEGFANMVAATGSDAARFAFLKSQLADRSTPLAFAVPLTARLSPQQRREILPEVLRRESGQFDSAVQVMGPLLGGAPLDVVRASPAYDELQANVRKAAGGDDSVRANASRMLDHALPRLGLLVQAAAARDVLTQLADWGLSPAEPRLDMLHFNIALTPENAP